LLNALRGAFSLFRLVVCLSATTCGVALSNEIALLNILPAIVFIFIAIVGFVNFGST